MTNLNIVWNQRINTFEKKFSWIEPQIGIGFVHSNECLQIL